MTKPNLTRMYDQLTPPERLRLVLAALEREDDQEKGRLLRTCPTHHCRSRDTTFQSQLETSERLTMAAGIDVAFHLGGLRMLQTLMTVLPIILRFAETEAIDNDWQQRMAAAASDESSASKSESNPQTWTWSTVAEHLPLTRELLQESETRLMAEQVRQVRTVLYALDALAREAAGTDADQLLAAWLPFLAPWREWFEQESEELADATPDETEVQELTDTLLAAWDRCVLN